MTVAATSSVTTIPSMTLATALANLAQATATLSAVVEQLTAQLGTGAAAGAATLAGGSTGTQTSMSGCMQSGASGALGGVSQLDDAAPAATTEPTTDSTDSAAPTDTTASTAPTTTADTSNDTTSTETQSTSTKSTSTTKTKTKKAAAPKTTETAPVTDTSGSSLGARLVAEAKKHLGKKYEWAAAGPNTFDCSGFVLYVAKQLGIKLPHKASMQATKGTAVAKKDLQEGDLVFFRTGRGISHVAIYAGNGKIVEAAGKGRTVMISNLSGSWYSKNYAGARRLS